jgi:hypothetical protein
MKAAEMHHSKTAGLLAYWRGLSRDGVVPARADLDPMAFRELLPQVLMLGRTGPGDFRFRLAGSIVEDLHGNIKRGAPVLPLWAEDDRVQLKAVLEAVARRCDPVVITTLGEAGPFSITLEVLFVPLAGKSGEVDRLLGLYQPLAPLARLHERPIEQLSVMRIAKASGDDAPRLRLAALSGRLVG